MNKLTLIVFFVVLFACKGNNPENNNKPNIKTNNALQLPKIEFDTEMHDFGKIKSGEILAYSFVFSNTGDTGLIINNAWADCGCLQIKFPKDEVKPNEKGLIEVVFNSAGMTGRQLKTVEIDLNSKETKHLLIFAEVENEQIEFIK